ncbi:MAG: hypothetical protein ACPGVH_02225 [Chitinophagales bacterium]
MKKTTALFMVFIFALGLLSSCGDHCDCPSFGKKQNKNKHRRR